MLSGIVKDVYAPFLPPPTHINIIGYEQLVEEGNKNFCGFSLMHYMRSIKISLKFPLKDNLEDITFI